MTDKPSEWALREARKYLDEISGHLNPEKHVAKWFEAAQRAGIEEAAKCIEGGRFLSNNSPIHREARSLATAIRAPADKEPSDE